MNLLTPEFFAATTIGSNASRFTEVLRLSSSSKLASFEMQARLMTTSAPRNTFAKCDASRMSPRTKRKFGFPCGRKSSPKLQISNAVTL